MKVIKCHCGKDILVDDEDYENLSQYAWACRDKRTIVTSVIGGNYQIARLVIEVPEGLLPDHRDGDIHNNQSYNLRVATHAQNAQNRPSRGEKTSGYRGVFPSHTRGTPNGRWCGSIKGKSLGTFSSAIEAAKAYDRAAIKQYGEFAYTNFPKEHYVET